MYELTSQDKKDLNRYRYLYQKTKDPFFKKAVQYFEGGKVREPIRKTIKIIEDMTEMGIPIDEQIRELGLTEFISPSLMQTIKEGQDHVSDHLLKIIITSYEHWLYNLEVPA